MNLRARTNRREAGAAWEIPSIFVLFKTYKEVYWRTNKGKQVRGSNPSRTRSYTDKENGTSKESGLWSDLGYRK